MTPSAAYRASYENLARDYMEHWRETGTNPFMNPDQVVMFDDVTAGIIRRYLPNGGILLDAGCAIGNVLGRLPEYERHGIDIAEEYLPVARDRGIDAVQGEIEHLPYSDEMFDGVLAVDVFEHVLDLNAATRELLRVLRPDGYLFARSPNAEDLAGYVDYTAYEYCHVRSWSQAGWQLFWNKVWGLPVLEYVPSGTELNVVVQKR